MAEKSLFIAEKPSVAMEFAKALKINTTRKNGYLENDQYIVTWCVGHLITLCYPEEYDESLKTWSLDTLPFIPQSYKYKVIANSAEQYKIVASLLNRQDISKIYYSGDSAREGEYIQRLVRQMAGHNPNAKEYRVWIDSQTEEEILRGIKEAKPLSAYDHLSDSAYARAIEDYLIGMNFSRMLTLKYSGIAASALGTKYSVVAVGRVMSCVLGMIVERERLIRGTKTISFYGINGLANSLSFDWKITEKSKFFQTPDNYNNIGLLNKIPVDELVHSLNQVGKIDIVSNDISSTQKTAPLLFNLAELQAECTKQFKISPADTLVIAQSLYEKKLTTYPRTDARVLTTAIIKVYKNNIEGLAGIPGLNSFVQEILSKNLYNPAKMANTKYVDDSKVSDHYAIIPTGQGLNEFSSLSSLEKQVYLLICKRFLSIFYPPAKTKKVTLTGICCNETFTTSSSMIEEPGFLEIVGYEEKPESIQFYKIAVEMKGEYPCSYKVHEGKSKPPARYTSGSMILAMENAGNLIDDPELREQIKSCGIGTSATRGEVISKLERNHYIKINQKTQIITPDLLGEIIYDILYFAVPHILNPKYTASWEKGLQGIADGTVTKEIYLSKINGYVTKSIEDLKGHNYTDNINASINKLRSLYPEIKKTSEMKSNTSDLKCPLCGEPLIKGDKNYYCHGYKNGCKFSISKKICGKTLPESVIRSFITTWKTTSDGAGESSPSKKISGFTSKEGKTFDASLKLSITPGNYTKMSFVFDKK